MVAGHHLHQSSMLAAMLRTRAQAEDEARLLKRAHELLDVMGLLKHAGEVAGSLPYGSQRRLEIARALMLAPKLLLLDEPAVVMNVCETVHVVDHGETIAEGPPQRIKQDPAVLAAYLGKSTEEVA